METVAKEFGRLADSKSYDQCIDITDHLLEILEAAKGKIKDEDSLSAKDSQTLKKQILEEEKQLKAREKEFYNSLSKYGKVLDKTFKLNRSAESNPKFFPPNTQPILNKAILVHLARSGEFDVASEFMNEASVNVPAHLLEDFSEMYQILKEIQVGDLGPAIQWARLHHEELMAKGSDLEFFLHSLQFMKLLNEGSSPSNAVMYARKNWTVYAYGDRYLDRISKLMASTLYVKQKDKSPYRDMYEIPSYEQVHSTFASEFCSLLGLPPQSPLFIAVTAGSIALPILAKIESMMKSRGAEWTTKRELPVEIDLPEEFQFHSIFVCPVSKEQTTKDNPPVALPCGHILANNTVRSLSKDNPTRIFKCPYCPMDCVHNQVKEVQF